MKDIAVNEVFRRSSVVSGPVCPPDQVFQRNDLEFIVDIGGGLFRDENQYIKFWSLLNDIKEQEFHILEKIGATRTTRENPFKSTISKKDKYSIFNEIVSNFDPPFGWIVNHFFVFGNNDSWGIYMCEYPTVNIIRCTKSLLNRFQEVFQIEGNGYEEIKDLINREFEHYPDFKKQFLNEYIYRGVN